MTCRAWRIAGMRRRKGHTADAEDRAWQRVWAACEKVHNHPLTAPLERFAPVYRCSDWRMIASAPRSAAVVHSDGRIFVYPTLETSVDEWVYLLAHCLLHLGFRHFRPDRQNLAWNTACDLFISRFLASLRLGRPPQDMGRLPELASRSEERIYQELCRTGVAGQLSVYGTAGPGRQDMVISNASNCGEDINWEHRLGLGLSWAVTGALDVAAGVSPNLSVPEGVNTSAQIARDWIMSSYPLLGAMAASFTIIEDPLVCMRMGISVAAVDAAAGEIYVNPAAGLSCYELRFVIAHELLHVSLRHQARRQGRDSYLWNVACDYVINSWLVEMCLGDMPSVGALHDPELKGQSAEGIYDLIVTDLRRYRRLSTLRGAGQGDILDSGHSDWWTHGEGLRLDEFYRRCIGQGLIYHETDGRGLLPAGLIEEVRALGQPPIPWDVELAQWFDDCFQPIEQRRTYARPSRRQGAMPDIPRPSWVKAAGAEDGRTFGVVLDTSGSVDRAVLARALGAIASYSLSRDVPAARVVFCDAAAYDQGYMSPDDIAGRVRVKGRGGTCLMKGVELLERACDFPKTGPILIITDGECDVLRTRREHAFLLPERARLSFTPRGRVFRIAG